MTDWPAACATELARPEIAELIQRAQSHVGKNDWDGRISIAIAARQLELVASGELPLADSEPYQGVPGQPQYITEPCLKAIVKALRGMAGI